MNREKALEILNLKEPITKKQIKKAYYSLAIKHHPDKSCSNSSIFLSIKEAYDFLNTYDYIDSVEDEDDANDYISLLQKCIKLVSPNTNWSNLFMDTTFKNIISDCENISLKIFKDLSKEKSIEVFSFLSTYKDLFHISEDTLKNMSTILETKRRNDNLILLTPSLDDLFDEKIYILELHDKKFYIPLWCHMLSYDINGDDLVVKCDPKLQSYVHIDEQNNIFVNVLRNASELITKDLIFYLGSREFKISSSELLIKEKQTYTLYNKGIPRFNQRNIYDVKKSHIYVNINLN
tara:strand:- start:44 stop:919 length:876 start_codon:yes stop_codon:yes gene_type:complete